MSAVSRRGLTILALIIAGDSVLLLPFVLARVFRPTLLDVFGLTNLELGTAFSAYGLVAMAAYFFGGPLADRFPPRPLLTIALASTAAGGLVLATAPSLSTLVILYAYWGVTTIALFWAPLIRATRAWGSLGSQGRAFGLLDGGRGLLAALMGVIMVTVFAVLLPDNSEAATLAQRTETLRYVILIACAMTFGAALLIWSTLPDGRASQTDDKLSLRSIGHVLTMPAVWLQAALILCAYVGFKATDDIALYANQVLGLNEVDAARTTVVTLWVRPVAAIGAGYLADRYGAPLLTTICFGMLAGGSVVLASGFIGAGMIWVFLLTIVCSCLGIFALRGLYFAIMQDGKIPFAYTGSAVGFVSVIGYTPDVFMGPLMGYLLDQSPGPLGHMHVFWVVSGFAFLGLLASAVFTQVARKPSSS
ncbi:MAG: MFS transporter [Alphaproteobacteria bacterium]